MSYGYVLLAVIRGNESRQRTLHENEGPIASLAALTANQQRDVKKRKEPYSLNDFCLYKPKEEKNLPRYVYGSAALKAISEGMYPSWALFCYKELAESAQAGYVPGNAIAVAHDAIILHPTVEPDGIRGLLIAQEAAGGQIREFIDSKGDVHRLTVPPVGTKIEAAENIKLFTAHH